MGLPRKLVTVTTAGVLALGGVGIATALVAPTASAVSVASEDSTTDRSQAISEALAGLVTAGTITAEQADAVATTLAESAGLRGRHGGRLLHLEAAATALGMTEDDLRTALAEEGATLTTVAEAQGVEVTALTDALTAAATDRIADRVADGYLTQAEADTKLAALPDRITALLTADVTDLPGRRGAGHGRGATDEAAAATPAG